MQYGWRPLYLNLPIMWYELKQNLQATKKYVTKLVHSSSHPSLRRMDANRTALYSKFPSSNRSCFDTNAGFFRLLMKGILILI